MGIMVAKEVLINGGTMNSRHVLYAMLCLAFIPLIGMERGDGKEKLTIARQKELKQSLLAAPSDVEMGDMVSASESQAGPSADMVVVAPVAVQETREEEPGCCSACMQKMPRWAKDALLTLGLTTAQVGANVLAHTVHRSGISMGAAILMGKAAANINDRYNFWLKLLVCSGAIAGDVYMCSQVDALKDDYRKTGLISLYALSTAVTIMFNELRVRRGYRIPFNSYHNAGFEKDLFADMLAAYLRVHQKSRVTHEELWHDVVAFCSKDPQIQRFPQETQANFIELFVWCLNQLYNNGTTFEQLKTVIDALPSDPTPESMKKFIATDGKPSLSSLYDTCLRIWEPFGSQDVTEQRYFLKIIVEVLNFMQRLSDPSNDFLRYRQFRWKLQSDAFAGRIPITHALADIAEGTRAPNLNQIDLTFTWAICQVYLNDFKGWRDAERTQFADLMQASIKLVLNQGFDLAAARQDLSDVVLKEPRQLTSADAPQIVVSASAEGAASPAGSLSGTAKNSPEAGYLSVPSSR